MSSNLVAFKPREPINSLLFRNPPDVVPPTDELESLQAELKLLRQKTMERAKKAGEDLKTIEESMRRMKEKEKGKAKAVDKIKREHEYTPTLEEAKSSPYTNNHQRVSSASSLPPSNGRSSVDPRRPLVEDPKKKKKRKREQDDSESDAESRRPPPPPVTTMPVLAKSQKTFATPSVKPLVGPDFTVPPRSDFLPQRPPLNPLPVPGPSKTSQVKEDFSKSKQPPNQILVGTFYSSIEPWIRPIKEEDIGFLEYTADEVEPFVMPKLGAHYTEVWAAEDQALYGSPLPGFTPIGYRDSNGMINPPAPKWDPSQLADDELWTEDRGHGPLTERVISALLPIADAGWKGVKAAEDAMEGRPGGNGAAAAARKEKMNVQDLETRIRDTMRAYGLLDGPPDFMEKVDDPIATALRQAQKELKQVMLTNKKRRERLAAIARDRLGYQEYIDLRDSIDRNIVNTYTKLQKKDAPKLSKKKHKKNSASGSGDGSVAIVNGSNSVNDAAAASGNAASESHSAGIANGINGVVPIASLPPCPAAVGLGPDSNYRLVVADHLKQLVETRRQWVDAVGAVFEEKERESPGRIWGFPGKSVFEGIDEDVKQILALPGGAVTAATMPAVTANGSGGLDKGKSKARSEAMDVG